MKDRRRNAIPKAWVYPVGSNQGKELIYHRLALGQPEPGQPPPPGYLHFHTGNDLPFFDSLTAEHGKEENYRGEIFTRYLCPKGKRNEALDCAVYAMAALHARKVSWARIEAHATPADPNDPEAQPPQAPKKKRTRRPYMQGVSAGNGPWLNPRGWSV